MADTPLRDERPVPRPVWSSSRLSAILAVVLVLEIITLTVYANYRVQSALDPENLGERVEEAVVENYPELRQELIAQVKADAPQIAEEVSRQMIAQAPQARQELEQLTARQLERGLNEAIDLSAEQFREVLRANREDIVQVFETIEEAPEDAHRLVLDMEADIEQQLQVDLQRQMRQALRAHQQLNDKLERLSSPDVQLDSRELLERRIVRILRTMQEQETLDPRVAEQRSTSPAASNPKQK